MSSIDIVKIIKACGESGVDSFCYGDLQIVFGSVVEEPAIATQEEMAYDVIESPIEEDTLEDNGVDETLFLDADEWDRQAREEAE